MKSLLLDAADRAAQYLAALAPRRVSPSPSALEKLSRFDRPLQNEPVGATEILRELDDIGSPATVASAGGRYFGFVIGGSLPATLAANILAGAWDQNAGLEVASPVGAALEKACRPWLIEALGLPPQTEVGFVTGATMANFNGLGAARHALLESVGWDVEAQGLFGAPPIKVIVGQEVHVSVLKLGTTANEADQNRKQVSVSGFRERLTCFRLWFDLSCRELCTGRRGRTDYASRRRSNNISHFEPKGIILCHLRRARFAHVRKPRPPACRYLSPSGRGGRDSLYLPLGAWRFE
jgi:hypothetical protein